MKKKRCKPVDPAEEIELKLALPCATSMDTEQRLAKLPMLVRRKATHLQLHNDYYDTPEELLRQQGMSLRLRRVGTGAHARWLQTLKMGGDRDSALSQRDEWETPVPSAALDANALKATPWSTLDPDGGILNALEPLFTTHFARTTWMAVDRDGSRVEVALDQGRIVAGDNSAVICELEIELLSGERATLFRVAKQVARVIAVLPLCASKAERGYALAHNMPELPRRAQPPTLASDQAVHVAAVRVLREMFSQFTSNLYAVLTSDDPEVVHQARIGWRRFKSGLKLFKQIPSPRIPAGMHKLLGTLGRLRDIEVASLETLPMLANAYAARDGERQAHWRAMEQALAQAVDQQRHALREALCEPRVGLALLSIAKWLERDLRQVDPDGARVDPKDTLKVWARQRITRLHARLNATLEDTQDAQRLHRVRILAKRLRYGIESLRAHLPKRRTQRWYLQAIRLQNGLGEARDIQQAVAIACGLAIDRGLADFLREVSVTQKQAP